MAYLSRFIWFLALIDAEYVALFLARQGKARQGKARQGRQVMGVGGEGRGVEA